METTREKLRKYYEKNAFTKNTMFGFDDVVKFAEIHANDVSTSQQQTIERLRWQIERAFLAGIAATDKFAKEKGFPRTPKEYIESLNTTEPEQNYYCSEVHKNGFYCEEQCERCKKADSLTEPIDQ